MRRRRPPRGSRRRSSAWPSRAAGSSSISTCPASIELRGHCLRLTLPPRPAGFPALQRLSLSGCRVDLADLTPLCPRLRVLAVAEGLLDSNITVKSGSLEELAAANLSRWTGRIDVDAPMLKKLALSFSVDGELGVSIVAPIVDKVSWECSYSRLTVGLDPWSLSSVSLHAAAEVPGEDDGARLQQHSNVLSLHMWACICLMSYSTDRPDYISD
ncbi:uncharacterized protein LOC119298838 [Triticum dicoccoides]|uniref:uncharacterized protein LOC119298838 n=1 Tax=Triticum dicoccoides TaxID=85692 RepID=UPI00188E72C8|nr:uncharacterized protein LOC119298838 [Triticum dicoccoides]XP_037432041.1 uncharacterized protein LOC119298838 [Triticum dicoccoides]